MSDNLTHDSDFYGAEPTLEAMLPELHTAHLMNILTAVHTIEGVMGDDDADLTWGEAEERGIDPYGDE